MKALIELKDGRSGKIPYNSPDYPVYIRQGVLSRYPNYAAPSHWHDDVELIAVLSGEAARNMIGFIQKNYTRKISLREIAASGAVGESKCCKLFARYFGQTPNTYLNQYRLNKSLGLLQNSDMPITEIALSVGFGGASYYAELFRKCVGKSQTEFRNHYYAANIWK